MSFHPTGDFILVGTEHPTSKWLQTIRLIWGRYLTSFRRVLSYGNTSNKNVQLVSQHCSCETSRKLFEKRWCAFYIPRTTWNLSRNKKNVLILLQKLERTSTFCNTLQQLATHFFCCETSCAWDVKSATMLRDKLDVFVARITVASVDWHQRESTVINWQITTGIKNGMNQLG